MPGLTDEEYRRLLEFRTGLRRFLRWSEEQAGVAGLTPAQHQLLLVIRAHEDPRGPTLGNIAAQLLIRHNSAVELVDRAARARLIRRVDDPADQRVVRLGLTDRGAQKLAALTARHLEELARTGPQLSRLWEGLDAGQPHHQ